MSHLRTAQRTSGLFLGTLGARLLSLAALGVSLGLVTDSFAVGTRHFVIETGAQFKKGELEGVAVDSSGFLRAGLDLGALEGEGAESVWAAMEYEGGLLLGTGNSGKLLSVKSGKVTELAKIEALAVTSIVEAFGKVIVGTMPGGKLYELKDKKLVEFAVLKDGEHVWALAFDKKENALYAATGPSGKLFRVTRDGTAQVYFDAPEGHLVSVTAKGGRVLAGSSGDARLYEITGPGRASVLYDFSSTEVRDIQIAEDGSVYAIVNELKGGPRTDNVSKDNVASPSKSSAKSGSGKLFKFDPSGNPEELFADASEHFVSLTLDAVARPIVGTGAEGRIIRVEANHQSAVLGDVEARQVTRVLGTDKGGWVVANDPVVVHPIEGVGGKEATWTSEVLDAGIRARFGFMDFDAQGRVEVSTRSGNTKEPDETWTDFSAPLTKPAAVKSAPGRYLQVRVKLLEGDKSRLTRLDVPFLTDNLRPVITGVQVKSEARAEGSEGVTSSGAPLEGKAKSKLKLSWDVDNPDQDTIRYRLEYRLESEKAWFLAQEPTDVLTSTSFEWETEDLPEGRYRVRVTASDELSNPPARVQSHQLESELVLVDNTPPRFSGLSIQGASLRGSVEDGIGPVRRLELRVAGQPEWIPFEPKDGIFDQRKEDFLLDLSLVPQSAGALLTVRAYDTAGNFEVAHVRAPAR